MKLANGKIRVLEISSYPPPRAGWGMRIFFLRREMEKLGHTCEVLNTGQGRRLTGMDFIPVMGGIDYILKVLKYRLKGYLIHMHLNGDSPKGFILTLIALVISLCTLKRPVITFHAGPVQVYFPQFKAPKLTPLYKVIFRIPQSIICNKNAVKRAIASYQINPDKIFPIPAFSKQYLEFVKTRLPERVEAFFREHDPVICSYVFFRPVFFIESMIDAVSEIVKRKQNFGLIIMGCDKGSEQIRKKISMLGLKSHVLLAGDQSHDEFLTILTRSKLYLRTHIKDGVCSSVLEALSLGVPVVACEDGQRPEGVVTYENEDVRDMADKIIHVLDNHEKIAHGLTRPKIEDTTVHEIKVLEAAY